MSSTPALTRGVVFVHSTPRALTRHLEWAISGVLGGRIELSWVAQPLAPGQVRADVAWLGSMGTAARLVSQLRTWPGIRLEVTEEPAAGQPGERYALTPALGLFRADIGPHGDVVLSEDRLRTLIGQSSAAPHTLALLIQEALGEPWDEELEDFRSSIDTVGARHLKVM